MDRVAMDQPFWILHLYREADALPIWLEIVPPEVVPCFFFIVHILQLNYQVFCLGIYIYMYVSTNLSYDFRPVRSSNITTPKL